MGRPSDSKAELRELKARLLEAEETLHAIRSGDVDALVVAGADGEQVFTLKGAEMPYREAMSAALKTMQEMPEPARQYLLPFGARSRFLFKMDFAEAEYISRVRSGVKGHFSYREIAWEMKQRVAETEPELAGLISATPPWIEDPLKR